MNLRIGQMAWIRPYFVTLCAVAALLAAYSWMFVSVRKTESVERRYRVLSSVSASIVKRLDHLQRWTSNKQRVKDRQEYFKSSGFVFKFGGNRRPFEGLVQDPCKSCEHPEEGEVRIDLDGSVHVVDSVSEAGRSIPYRSTLEEILGALNDGDFDAVLITLPTGQVIEQQSGDGGLPELTALEPGRDGETIVLQDRRYRVFLSPVSLSAGAFVQKKAAGSGDLLLAALVRESTLLREAMQLPYGLVVALGALILLGTVALPFFRFYYLDPSEPYRRGDVMVLGLSGLVGVAAATILLLDVFAGRSIASDLDRDAETISDAVLRDLGRELDSVADDLRVFFQHDAPDLLGDRLTARCVGSTQRCISSGYIDTLLRIDAKGYAMEKWTNASALSGAYDYGARPYFRQARNGVLSRIQAPARESGEPYVFDIVRAQGTGTLTAVVALPRTTEAGEHEVVAASFRSRVLSAPVLPAGYTMLVINHRGEVFEHSGRDPLERQRSENLLAELSEPGDLEAAILTRGADRVEIRYRGSTHSAYITPLGGFPFFLLILRDQSLVNAIGLEIVGASLVLYCVLLAALCGVIAFWSYTRGRRIHDLLWPDPRRARGYTRVAWLSLGGVALWALAAGLESLTWKAVPVWPVAIAVPVLQIALLAWACRPMQTASAPAATARGHLGLSVSLAFTLGMLPAAVLYFDAFNAHMETLVRLDQLTIVRGIDETISRRTRIFDDLCPDASKAGCALRAWHPSSGVHDENHGTAVSSHAGTPATPSSTREPTIRAVYLSRALAESVEPIAPWATDSPDLAPAGTAGELAVFLRSPAAWLLSTIPAYSEQSKQFRRLLIDRGSSGRWSFSPFGSWRTLTDRASWAGPLRVKAMAPSAAGVLAPGAGRVAFLAVVALLFLALVRVVLRAVVHGLFGPPPHGDVEHRAETPAAARAVVLVAPRSAIDALMRSYPRASVSCLDLRLPREVWMQAEQAARQRVAKVFLLDGLEALLEEGDRLEALLVLLQQLLEAAPSAVVLVCEEDPLAILDAQLARADGGHPMRRAILHQLRSCMSEAETAEIADMAAALRSAHPIPGANLAGELGSIAERQYRELWKECSVPERLVLFHVARDGFIGRNSWGLTARLQRRGLLRKDPVLRIRSAGFRAFVLRAEALPTFKEWEARTGAGGAHVRGALIVAALAAGAFFLFTQRDQVTALATILPALATILSAVPRMFAAIPSNRTSGASAESS